MSTTVSNPYSFNIKNNTSFSSPAIQSNLPQTNTLLDDISDVYDNNYHLTIPSGVNVIYCSGIVSASVDGRDGECCEANLIIKNNTNNKYWKNDTDKGVGGDTVSAFCEYYIGVTPGKTYNLSINTTANFESYNGYPGYVNSDVKIYYSASINNHAINVADY
mgnify:CR=1 FL=1